PNEAAPVAESSVPLPAPSVAGLKLLALSRHRSVGSKVLGPLARPQGRTPLESATVMAGYYNSWQAM
ncbi:unnamed protein product, partial [Ostreobium quekettii]